MKFSSKKWAVVSRKTGRLKCLECTAARKRWHKEHKQAIREHLSADCGVQE